MLDFLESMQFYILLKRGSKSHNHHADKDRYGRDVVSLYPMLNDNTLSKRLFLPHFLTWD